MRGVFRKRFHLKKDKLSILDVVAVGDTVEFNFNDDGTGTISDVYPRSNYLSRKAPKVKGGSVRGERFEQIIAANLDSLVIITSSVKPEFNNRLLDRILVAGSSSGMEVLIVINKIDLLWDEYIEAWSALYSDIGYNVHNLSAKTEQGLSSLRDDLINKTSIFWGQSGVGKSTLLNKLFPSLSRKTGEISDSTNKGTHTTVSVVLEEIDDSTFVIDTPGIREIDPYGIKKEDLWHYFVEFKAHQDRCRFNTCTHHHEPGCGIIEAVENELVSPERYISYINMLESIEDDMIY